MRRRIQAVPRAGNGRCDCGPIGVRLARNGRPGPAVGPGTEAGGGAIQGPFFQTISSEEGIHVFSVFMLGILGTESILWADGGENTPSTVVEFSDPSAFTPQMTVTYDFINFAYYQCSVDGVVYRGNVEA